jgi:hypothetical protein
MNAADQFTTTYLSCRRSSADAGDNASGKQFRVPAHIAGVDIILNDATCSVRSGSADV